MNTDALHNLGLTEVQAGIYLALLKTGSASSGEIIKQTGRQASVVYYALKILTREGLVSSTKAGKRSLYAAASPSTLETIMQERLQRIHKLVPRLEKLRAATEMPTTQTFIGWKGVFAAFNTLLETLPEKSEYIGFAAGLEKEYNSETTQFFKEFQKKRAAKKYRIRLIANEVARTQVERYPYYVRFGKPRYRYVDGYAAQGMIIFGNNILMTTLEEPMAIIINSPAIANSYRQFFENMWIIAKN